MKEDKKGFDITFDNTTKEHSQKIHYISYRSFIKKNDKYLIIKTNRGDIIFPGGGIEAGETGEQAASREVQEETGYRASTTPEYIGTVTSKQDDKFKNDGSFEIECRYYVYEVYDEPAERDLTRHEEELEIQAMWMTKDEIIKSNREYCDSLVVKDYWVDHVEWLLREEW